MGDITHLRWGLPSDWVGWDQGDLAGCRADVDALDEDERTSSAIVAAATMFERAIATDLPGTTFAALWVPGVGIRRPLATGALRVAAPPPGGRPDVQTALALARRSTTPRGTRLVDVAAMPSRVSAGDAVLRIVDKAPRLSRRVSREWTWIILPPRTDRMVLCQVESPAIAHFDEIADMTTDIANSVVVTLGAT